MQKHRATHSCTSFTVFPGMFFSKRLGQLFIWAALLMVPFLTSAQSWDTVRVVDFSGPSFNQDLGGVQGFNAVGFSLGNHGASGTNSDLCAFTSSFSAQDRIAMRVSLQAGVDYRVSLNGKVNRPGQAVDFAYAPASNPQQVTVISQSIPLADIDYNDPGATVESSTFAVAADGNYWVAAEHGGVNLPDVFARLDNFMVEALDQAPTPGLSLADRNGNPITGTVDAEPGTPFTLCLSPNIAPPEDTTAILSITGSHDPHFSDFDSINLTFPAGSTDTLCFELSPASDTIPGTYTFQLTDGNGEEVMSFEVGVEPCSVAGPDHNICAGGSVQLGTGCLPAPHPVDSVEYCYAWEPADGLDDPASAMPNATPSETTTYTVYVTTSEGELIVEDEVTVTVKTIDQLSLTAHGGRTLCEGTEKVLQVSIAGNINDYNIVWSTGDTTAEITIAQAGAYHVTVIDTANCTATDTIAIEAIAADTLLIMPTDPMICEGSVDINATEGFTAYTWIAPSGEVYGNYSSITVDTPGWYKVYGINDYGCEVVDSVMVTEGITGLNVSPSSARLCLGGSLTMSAPEGFQAYYWLNTYGNELGTGRFLEINRTGSYILSVTDANGCHQSHEFFVDDSEAQNIEILPKDPSFCFADDPTFTPNEGDQGRSSGSCTTGSNILEVNGDYASVQWSTGELTPTISVTETGTYSVTVTDENGCTNSDQVRVKACTSPGFELSPFPVHLCDDSSSVIIDAGPGYNLYEWSDGTTGQSIEVNEAGDYGVTVTDVNGCTAKQDFSIKVLSENMELDLSIYKPEALAGNDTTLVVAEDSIGAMAFLNIDNDDGDRKSDLEDNEVEGGDNDLMRLVVTLKPGSADTIPVYLRAISGEEDIRIWKTRTKKKGEEFQLGDTVVLVEQILNGDTVLTAEYWVEGIKQHTSQRATVLRASCNDNPDCPVADEVSITIVGMLGMQWKGMGNGFAGPDNTESDSLDTDNSQVGNSDTFSDGSPLQNKRVFPGGRIDPGGTTVSSLRDIVKVEARLSVTPVEPLTLYVRSFDVDDSSAKGGEVDPNDQLGEDGFYSGTSNFYPPNGIPFNEDQDNRGAPEGHDRKEGRFVDDADDDGIVELVFDGVQNIETNFQVSILAGDNYRAAGAFDRAYLERLQNLDRKHGLHIVDPEQRQFLPGLLGFGDFSLSHLFSTNVLTVWRLLHVEYDSMDNLTVDDNAASGTISGFKGSKLSGTDEFTMISVLFGEGLSNTLEDFPSISDPTAPPYTIPSRHKDYGGGEGRFEDGGVYLGGKTGDFNEVAVRSNGERRLLIKRSPSKVLPLTFNLLDSVGDMVASGEVQEILNPADNTVFFYELDVQTGSLPAAQDSNRYRLRLGLDSMANPVHVIQVDTTNNRVVSDSLSIGFLLWDDDARPEDNLLPYDFVIDSLGLLADMKAYNDAFVEPISVSQMVNSLPITKFKANLPTGDDMEAYYNNLSDDNLDADIKKIESGTQQERIWLAYCMAAFQTFIWRRDNDPNSEVDPDPIDSQLNQQFKYGFINLGSTPSTQGSTDSVKLARGTDGSYIPFETFRDHYGSSSLVGRSIAHEIGHQFGLGHLKSRGANLMNELLDGAQNNNGRFHPVHLNLIRSRKFNPGIPPSL